MDDRKKQLELYAKQVSEGLPFADDFLQLPDGDVANNALLARNLNGEALAHQVLKNTGIPIPNDNASKAKIEDFYHRIMEERYPELKPKIITGDLSAEGANGWFDSSTKTIGIDQNLHKKQGMNGAVSTLLHEAGHQFDNQTKIPNANGHGWKTPVSKPLDLSSLRKAHKEGIDLKNMDPAQVYEIFAKEHHATIPKLREGTYELGALKSMMKSGTFKQVAGALPLVGGIAAATMSGDASAAVPLLDEADDVGESRDDEAGLRGESKGFNDYQKSAARMDALKKMGQ